MKIRESITRTLTYSIVTAYYPGEATLKYYVYGVTNEKREMKKLLDKFLGVPSRVIVDVKHKEQRTISLDDFIDHSVLTDTLRG